MQFEFNIFKYFSKSDKRVDSNKDGNNKGTLERFNECIGADIDDLTPFIDSILDNLYNPETCFDRYVPYLESMTGFDIDKGLIYLYQDLDWRRRVLKHVFRYYNIKGTKKGYEVLFQLLGITMSLTEYDNTNSFDSPLTFDSPGRVFDRGRCFGCSGYTLDLVGPTLTPELNAAILNIIKFNQPINAILQLLTYNSVPIGGA